MWATVFLASPSGDGCCDAVVLLPLPLHPQLSHTLWCHSSSSCSPAWLSPCLFQIGMRWRTETEVVNGKGWLFFLAFRCCSSCDSLLSHSCVWCNSFRATLVVKMSFPEQKRMGWCSTFWGTPFICLWFPSCNINENLWCTQPKIGSKHLRCNGCLYWEQE